MDATIEKVVQDKLLKATEMLEHTVDKEIEKLGNLNDDDLEALRKRRLAAMKKLAAENDEFRSKGHGEYSQCDEKEFFDVCKKSKMIVCHFYRNSTFRCKILDKHMDALAKTHLETRFVKIDVEKAPFLVEKLKVRVLPSLALLRDQQVVDYVVGFDELGGTDDFPTEMLEWRLAKSHIISYQGDLNNPPEVGKKSKDASSVTLISKSKKKTIRGTQDDDSDSD